jgi:aspartate/methionine/tyrosine aminotransferase
LKEEILGRGLSALLVSNPCNPTGQLMEGKELSAWCALARECQCSVIFDEFYSHYIYTDGKARGQKWFPPPNLSKTWSMTRLSSWTA